LGHRQYDRLDRDPSGADHARRPSPSNRRSGRRFRSFGTTVLIAKILKVSTMEELIREFRAIRGDSQSVLTSVDLFNEATSKERVESIAYRNTVNGSILGDKGWSENQTSTENRKYLRVRFSGPFWLINTQ